MLEAERKSVTLRHLPAVITKQVLVTEMFRGAWVMVTTLSGSMYQFRVLDGEQGWIELDSPNSKQVKAPAVCRFLGSVPSRRSRSLNSGEIKNGLCLIFTSFPEDEEKTIWTSPVASFSVFPPQPFRLVSD